MKKFMALMILLLSTNVFAGAEITESTTKLNTDSNVISIASGYQYWLQKIKWVTDGTNDLTIKVYDHTIAGGKILAEYTIEATQTPGVEYFDNLPLKKGLYVDITTSGNAGYWIQYKYIPRR